MEFFSFNQLPLYTKDFYFRELNDNNKDAIDYPQAHCH